MLPAGNVSGTVFPASTAGAAAAGGDVMLSEGGATTASYRQQEVIFVLLKDALKLKRYFTSRIEAGAPMFIGSQQAHIVPRVARYRPNKRGC